MSHDTGMCLELKLHCQFESAKTKEKPTVTFEHLSGPNRREILMKQLEICCGECNRPFNSQFDTEHLLGAQCHCMAF